MSEGELKAEINKQAEYFRIKAQEDFKIDLNSEQLEKFKIYTELLLEWNKKINLTAINDPRDIMIKHFLDSLAFVKYIIDYYPDTKIRIADLGTGAGFPGIPLSIVLPDVHIVLIDALAKRVNFLNEVIKELELKEIITLHARAEDAGRNKQYREFFDLTVVRAVAELPILLEYASPLLKVGGRLMAAKGIDPEKEFDSADRALNVLNCEQEHVDKYRLADGADYRSMIIIKKVDFTPGRFPRQAGKPKKNPL